MFEHLLDLPDFTVKAIIRQSDRDQLKYILDFIPQDVREKIKANIDEYNWSLVENVKIPENDKEIILALSEFNLLLDKQWRHLNKDNHV